MFLQFNADRSQGWVTEPNCVGYAALFGAVATTGNFGKLLGALLASFAKLSLTV